MTMTIPTTIGPYRIDRELGRGGMGVVFLGHDTRLNRAVAIKALPPEVASDAERLQRFEREAKVLASLSHPNIAAIYGVEESGGRATFQRSHLQRGRKVDPVHRPSLREDDAAAIVQGADRWKFPARSDREGRGRLGRETGLAGGSPKYSPTGHLLFSKRDVLFAVPFDLGRLELKGTQVALQGGLRVASTWGNAEFRLSSDGTLLHVLGGDVGQNRHDGRHPA
jgi:hypothetical protein